MYVMISQGEKDTFFLAKLDLVPDGTGTHRRHFGQDSDFDYNTTSRWRLRSVYTTYSNEFRNRNVAEIGLD